MAVSVNTVYRAVLTILNREQRGHLTPEQFNRLAKQAQLELLEKSFYDYNRQLTKRNIQGVNSEYGDIAENIKEKIDAFAKEASLSFTTGVASNPDDLYRIVQVFTDSDRDIEVEKIKKSELTYLNASPLTKPTSEYPVYFQEAGNIKIFPTSITSASIDYIKTPAAPLWNSDAGTNNSRVFRSTTAASNPSVDFTLHPSEEPNVIIKILSYVGIIIKDPSIVQVATQQQEAAFNKENI